MAIDHTPSTAHSTSHSRTGAINSESLDSDAIRAGITAKRSNSNSSILSNNTVVTQNGTTKKVSKRKSVLGDGLAYNEHNIAGRKKLTADMLEYIKDESVDSKTANAVKEESTTNPSVLLGWQVQKTVLDYLKISSLYLLSFILTNHS